MAVVRLDGRKLTDRASFHEECKAAFGFPDFYGRNMDAWVDCLSGLRDDDGMTKFSLAADEMLDIEISYSDQLRIDAPAILRALIDGATEVNELNVENGEKPALNLVLR